jgi:hypothetical protein
MGRDHILMKYADRIYSVTVPEDLHHFHNQRKKIFSDFVYDIRNKFVLLLYYENRCYNKSQCFSFLLTQFQ